MSFDPSIGRWLSEDPIGFTAADPNLYRYGGNNPTNEVDPSGLQAVWKFGDELRLGGQWTLGNVGTPVVIDYVSKGFGVPKPILANDLEGTIAASADIETALVFATRNGPDKGRVQNRLEAVS
jgi:uncharacterized protein RhaS with RHS repeats